MDISIKSINEKTIIMVLDGDIDIYTSSDLKDMLIDQIDIGIKNIIVDLELVSYIDSSGIGVFISTLATLKKIDGSMCIIKPSESVKKVFELTKLTSFFKLFKDEESALNLFK